MSAKIKKIVLVGNSEKFNKIIRQLYSRAEIVVIPWRTTIETLKKIELSNFLDADLILVCGYDYSSSAYHYHKYIDANVTSPLEAIKVISNPDTLIIYIDTLHSAKPYTLSRYQYAKYLLGVGLREHFNHLTILNIPTIVNQNGKVDVQGGVFTKLVFNALNQAGILKTITTSALSDSLFRAVNNLVTKKVDVLVLRSKFLQIRRTLFLDRLLRFVGG
jgi:hypothetical protein